MEFHVLRSELSRELQLLQGVIEKKKTMPILANIYIKAENNKLTLNATDLEIGIQTAASAQVVEPGEFTVNAKQFQDMLNSFSGSQVTISQSDLISVDLECDGASFSVETMPTQDFPSLPSCDFEKTAEIEIGFFEKCLGRVLFSVSTDSHKYVMNGALLKIRESFFQLVGLDGHRMSIVSKELDGLSGDYQAIIPRRSLIELNKLLKAEPEDDLFEIAMEGDRIFFRVGTRIMSSRMIDGKFPDYERAVPQANNLLFQFEREQFLDVVKRKAIMSTEKSKQVHLALKPGEATIALRSPGRGKSIDKLGIEYDGEPADFGVNVDYLHGFLRAIDTPGVQLWLRDETSAGLFRLHGDETGADYTHTIMPMRLTER
jgi:DNA polymerase-3 subunit beta